MIRILRILPVLFTLFIYSCGDSNLLMTLSDSGNAVLFRSSISGGEILNPESGEAIEISMEYDDSVVRPVKLEIAFLDAQGIEISEPQIIDGEALNEPLPSLSINAPEQEMYSLRLRVFDESDFIIKEETIPFFYSSAILAVRDMKTYPNSFIPGGNGLVLAEVDSDDSTWARWTIDSEIIEEGFISDYENGLIWKAPAFEGVYRLSLELFPVRPLYTANGTFPFSSSVRSEIVVYVSETAVADSSDLFPPESYSTLVHFNGLVEDEGTDPHELRSIGNPRVRRDGDKFGIYLDGSSGYVIEDGLLPFKNNLLMPFSVTFSYFITELQSDRTFFDISSGDEYFFRIKTNPSGILLAELYQDGGGIIDSSGIVPDNYSELTVSVVPNLNDVSIYWYGDGLLLSSGVYSYKNTGDPGDLISRISGADGFTGLIDEFGIYVRDEEGRANIDGNIFRRRVNRQYNPDRVIAVLGFDDLDYSDGSESGIYKSSGVYEIYPGAELKFVETDFNFSHLYIDIDFMNISDSTEIHIDFPEEDNINSLHINLEDILPVPETSLNIELELVEAEGVLSVNYMGIPIAKADLMVQTSAVFSIYNNSEADISRVSSVLVRREEKRVVKDIIQTINEKL